MKSFRKCIHSPQETSPINIDLQVREIVVAAATLPDVSHVRAGSRMESLLDDDSGIWVWHELERQFDIVVTRAMRKPAHSRRCWSVT